MVLYSLPIILNIYISIIMPYGPFYYGFSQWSIDRESECCKNRISRYLTTIERMDSTAKEEQLLVRIKELELENQRLKQDTISNQTLAPKKDEKLSLDEYERYGRQMIVPEFGSLPSQIKLRNAKILVVGVGGLGCPALLYLSAAGIGQIGIVDDDLVDKGNLHRQVLHTTETVGMAKCDSAKSHIAKLNPHVSVVTYPTRLDNTNAFEIFEQYDLILDCTDAPAVRYLINDVAVILGKTVVSGSGLKTDGQWTILNFENMGPCYRCFHPKPPAADSITSCQDGGVIGPAIGIIGLNMALETIKVLTGYYLSQNFKPFMCAFYGYQFQQYRTFKMRGKQSLCEVCGDAPTVTRDIIESNQLDYHVFCGRSEPYQLQDNLRVSVQEYKNHIQNNTESLLIDVRPKEQFDIASLPNSINIPWGSDFRKRDLIDDLLPDPFQKDTKTFVICRFGNDSQIAAQTMLDKFGFTDIHDIRGGVSKWSEQIDQMFPRY